MAGAPFIWFGIFLLAAIAGVLLRDEPALALVALLVSAAGLIGGIASSPEARASLPGSEFVASVVALQRRTLLLTLAGIVVAFTVAELWERVMYPEGTLRAYLDERYRYLGTERLALGGDGRVYADRTALPIEAAARLEQEFPADDQRYTPAGVFLRYERHIMAVVSDGRRGSELTLMREVDGYLHLYAYVGDFWGASYLENTSVAPSARSVPGRKDVAAVTELLDEAEAQQGVCFGWSVEIRSGRREGTFEGAPPRIDAEGRADKCGDRMELGGWIDPNAERFSRRGPRGEWNLEWDWRLPESLPRVPIDAISVNHGELIDGATTEPTGGGERAGKGLIEYLGALPLLAEAASAEVPPVDLRRPPASAVGARPAPAKRSDNERRAEDSAVTLLPAVLRVGAGFALAVLLIGVPAGLVRRASRGDDTEPKPERRRPRRRRGRRRGRSGRRR